MLKVFSRLLLMVMLFSLILAGCSSPEDVAGPRLIQTSPGYNVVSLDVTLDDTGGTNLIFDEKDPDTGATNLVFVYLRNGQLLNRIVWQAPVGEEYKDPQIAVERDSDPVSLGRVYVVFNHWANGNTSGEWISFMPDATNQPWILTLDSNMYFAGLTDAVPPQLVAYNNFVYAAYYVEADPYNHWVNMAYRQLAPTVEESVQMSGVSAPVEPAEGLYTRYVAPDLTIGTDGKVHIISIIHPGNANQAMLYYVNNVSGINVKSDLSPVNVTVYEKPSILVTPGGFVQYAYATNTNHLIIREFINNGQDFGNFYQMLGSEAGWTVEGPVDGELRGGTPTFVVSASYTGSPSTGFDVIAVTDATTTNLSNQPGDESYPRLVNFEEGDMSQMMAAGWRQWIDKGTLGDVSIATYASDGLDPEVRTVFRSPYGANNAKYEMDGLSNNLVGAWVDEDPRASKHMVVYVAWNADLMRVYSPMISR